MLVLLKNTTFLILSCDKHSLKYYGRSKFCNQADYICIYPPLPIRKSKRKYNTGRYLIRELPDALDEVLVRLPLTRKQLAQDRDHLERILVVYPAM